MHRYVKSMQESAPNHQTFLKLHFVKNSFILPYKEKRRNTSYSWSVVVCVTTCFVCDLTRSDVIISKYSVYSAR